MGFGKRVIGEQAYADSGRQGAVSKAAGGFGPRVIGQAAYDAAHPKATDAAAELPAIGSKPGESKPTEGEKTPVEAYNVAGAIAKAKQNPADLPRLLKLEMARADGPRKGVLRAYDDMLAAGDTKLPEETVVAMLAQIAEALGEAPAAGKDPADTPGQAAG